MDVTSMEMMWLAQTGFIFLDFAYYLSLLPPKFWPKTIKTGTKLNNIIFLHLHNKILGCPGKRE